MNSAEGQEIASVVVKFEAEFEIVSHPSVSAEASQLGTRLDSGPRGAQLVDAEASPSCLRVAGGVMT